MTMTVNEYFVITKDEVHFAQDGVGEYADIAGAYVYSDATGKPEWFISNGRFWKRISSSEVPKHIQMEILLRT